MKRFLLALVISSYVLAQQGPVLESSKAIKVLPLDGTTFHVQGIDTDGVHLWVTSVDTPHRKGYLHEFLLKTGKLVRSVELQDGERFHPGGIAADNDSIWIPVAEYRRQSTAVIQQRDKRTLALKAQFMVADHIGCVAVTPAELIGGNWDSKEFYVWDHTGKLIRKVSSPTTTAYQDLKFRDGSIVGSGTQPDKQGAVDWLDLSLAHLTRRMLTGTAAAGASLSREGMTIVGDQIWFVPEDGPSRLFVLPLPKP